MAQPVMVEGWKMIRGSEYIKEIMGTVYLIRSMRCPNRFKDSSVELIK